MPMDGPILELVNEAPPKTAAARAEPSVEAADPVKGAPVVQLQVGPAPSKTEAAEGRSQIDYAAWRDQQLIAAQVRYYLC